MASESNLRAKRLARLHARFVRASEEHEGSYHIAAYADDSRLQDLLTSRVRRHTWDEFDLASREFRDWFDIESNHLWVWIGEQTDLPVEHHGSDSPPVFGSSTHVVHMPENPWFGRVAGISWIVLGGAEKFATLAREAAYDLADVTDEPTGCWLGRLYQLFPDHRSTFVLDQPHTASAFLSGDKIEIAWLPWNVFLASAKAIELLLEKGITSAALRGVAEPAQPDEDPVVNHGQDPALEDNRNEETANRRPAYDRDHRWLAWHEQEKLGAAKIRDRWDSFPDEERKAICPTAWEKVGGKDDAKTQKAGYEVVRMALRKAKRERIAEADRGA